MRLLRSVQYGQKGNLSVEQKFKGRSKSQTVLLDMQRDGA